MFVYVKNRKVDTKKIQSLLEEKNLNYTWIVYGSYSEDDYIRIVQKSKFGIWIGSHESQGFALEEALSMNCPLLVLDAQSMHEEFDAKNGR